MTAFSVDAALALPGPEWLRDRRAAAAERFAGAALPSAEEEVWRYSRIAELDLAAFTPASGGDGTADIPAPETAVLQHLAARAAIAVVVDGRLVHVEGDLFVDATGAAHALGSVATEAQDVFTTLNDAFVVDPIVVRVPPGTVVPEPIVVVHWAASDGVATFPRLVVQAGADSQCRVIEVHGSPDTVAAFTAPVTEIDVGPAARVGFTSVQASGFSTWQIGSQVSQIDADATFVSAVAGLGGEYARQRTDCRLTGRGASGDLLAVYFGEGDQTLDFRTFQDHIAPETTSNLLFKGAVAGHSRSIYTGLIHVGKNARGTNAFQTNRNIKLSDDAWAESVPNLEIENNDVRCSHASAVGPIDEDQRFYLESRGVPPAVAERLVVGGFFDEVLTRLPAVELVPWLRAILAEKLLRREAA